jgi:antitoxin (DNA-binding transcriptional repressor) of toxin-antitoxin stability system
MQTVGIKEAQARLPELVDSAASGKEVLIARDDKPVARLTGSIDRPSLSAIRPVSVGAILRPSTSDDDLLEETTMDFTDKRIAAVALWAWTCWT